MPTEQLTKQGWPPREQLWVPQTIIFQRTNGLLFQCPAGIRY